MDPEIAAAIEAAKAEAEAAKAAQAPWPRGRGPSGGLGGGVASLEYMALGIAVHSPKNQAWNPEKDKERNEPGRPCSSLRDPLAGSILVVFFPSCLRWGLNLTTSILPWCNTEALVDACNLRNSDLEFERLPEAPENPLRGISSVVEIFMF